MRGLVIKSTGSSYLVRMDDGQLLECHIKGNFRIRGIRSTNPVAVGDYVIVESQKSKVERSSRLDTRISGENNTYWITDVEPRRNYIIRRSTNLSKESHIIAANLDQVALLVTINHPQTSTVFIDRFLATAEAYRVPALLIFNKTDLLNDDELLRLQELRELYESLGYQTLALSAISLHPSEIIPLLRGKTTLLSGNSGVGKSTLLNALFGREIARTGEISTAHNKGMHTTTFSEMYFLEMDNGQWTMDNGAVIDTPGIKGFGSIDMQREEISHYFREIFRVGAGCRFGNCSHTNEPGCAVLPAVERDEIALSRYESYLSLLSDCEEEKYR
ncbi:MAG: ribosome small subunit-dependent GTPase A [Paludibacteraceae bacterium]|nr:ribosome small subunit-dependent GTPase A [Paludibacteraceae bacterium]